MFLSVYIKCKSLKYSGLTIVFYACQLGKMMQLLFNLHL